MRNRIDTDMGEPVLHTVLRPSKGKFFFSADEVVQEAIKVLTDFKYGG